MWVRFSGQGGVEQNTRESAGDYWRRQRLERRLASDKRAGAWARSRAIRMRYDFIRRGWLLVALWPAVACAVAPAVLLVPHHDRPYIIGGLVASGIWGALYMVGTMSGASSVSMGALSEQWTASDLRRLKRRGWKLVNQVHFRRWDIDHMLLGPGGVIVVVTKFSADGWTPTRYTARVIADAVNQAKRNATDIQLSLGKSVLPDSLVHSLVVLWGRGDKKEIAEKHGSVQVLSGHLLPSWLAHLDDAGLEDATVPATTGRSALADRLDHRIANRHRHDHPCLHRIRHRPPVTAGNGRPEAMPFGGCARSIPFGVAATRSGPASVTFLFAASLISERVDYPGGAGGPHRAR